MTIKLHIWQRNLGLMGELCYSASAKANRLATQEGVQGNCTETPLSPATFQKLLGSGYPPKQRWPLVRPVSAKDSFLLLCRPLQEPGTHLCLPPGKALLAGMQGRRVKSQNNVLPLPQGAGVALYI